MEKLIAKIAVSSATYWIDKPYDYIVPAEHKDRILPGMRVAVPFSRGNRASEGIVLALSMGEDNSKLKFVSGLLDEEPVISQELMNLAMWMHERFFCTVYEAVKAMLPAGIWFNLSSRCAIAQGITKEAAYEAAGRSKAKKQALDIVYSFGGACEFRDVENAFDGDPTSAIKALASNGILDFSMKSCRRVRDKTTGYALLAVPGEDALQFARSRKKSAPSQAAVLELLSGFGGATINDIRYLTGAGPSVIKRLEAEELISIEQIEVFRRPSYRTGESKEMPELTDEQETAFRGILKLTERETAGAALLYGVTGSGKTLVYIRLISEILSRGRSVILLVPEIALTPQMLQTFSSYFGENIAVMHSSLSMGERYDEWKRIRSGAARVVIGTRSAVFAPVSNLGIIIMDEEHEDTYKSENTPRYHAKDVAKYRCSKAGATLLLGSATPNIDSFYYAQTGRYSFFSLPTRFNQMSMPQVEIVDMKRELRQGNGGDISSVLASQLRENISEGRQSILFLNRRGMNNLISCAGCGFVYKCPRCSVSLTYHSVNKRLMCHYCGHSQKVESSCPECGGRLNFIGTGTQKLQEELNELFPEVPVIRLDADTVGSAGSHQILLDKFREENIPIMVGTQMVTKGLDFPNVTLVGVISADQSLYAGDYRAQERTFSLITQVVGRSGRGDVPGRAVIQTFTPQNQVILQAAHQDYDSFYRSELEMRRLQWCPPFSELFAVTATGRSESDVLRCLSRVKSILSGELRNRADVRILGPAPFPVVRVSDRFRYRLIVAGGDDKQIRSAVSGVIYYCNTNKEFKGVSVFGDINPNL